MYSSFVSIVIMRNRAISLFFFQIVISPRLASYLGKKGYSLLPMDTINYLVVLLNQVLDRRRQHLEKRNDFIQMMVDHEEEVKREEETEQHIQGNGEHQQRGNLKKSNLKNVFHN